MALAAAEIEMFHMTQFEADRGEFAGWKRNFPEKRKRLLNELLDLITEHVPLIVGFSSSHAEHRSCILKIPMMMA